MNKRIAITMGDPNGIGPEIIAKMWQDKEIHTDADFFVVGRCAVMEQAVRENGFENPVDVLSVADLNSNQWNRSRSIPVLEVDVTDGDIVAPAAETEVAGRVAYQAIKTSAELALANQIDAMVTAPINKKSLNLAGIQVPGHTELLAQFCEAKSTAMMLYLPPTYETQPGDSVESKDEKSNKRDKGLSIVHCTLHTSMRSIFDLLTQQLIEDKIDLANAFCKRIAQAGSQSKRLSGQPKIGIAALNPHAGEQGLFGDEEITVISPAVKSRQNAGVDAHGPFPVDTLMRRAASGEFDAIVAMYHDQGHIAVKLLDMFGAVNITLGLPIIRTSVAHGTAADKAWSGNADERSLTQAARVAIDLANSNFNSTNSNSNSTER